MNLSINENNIIMEFDHNEDISSFQTKMIKLNEFNELVYFKPEITLDTNKITYDTSNLISIDDYTRNNNVIKGELELAIKNIEEKIKEHMLLINNIRLDSKFIFINKNKLNDDNVEFKFVYVPLKREQTNFERDKNNLLNNKELFEKSTREIKEYQEQLLDDLINSDEIYDTKIKTRKIIKGLLITLFLILMFVFRKYKLATIITVISFIVGYLIYYIISFTDDEKEYQDSLNDDTIVIQNYPYLKKGILDEKIMIMKNIFTIGKDNKNDLVINENSISKSHAKIIKKNSEYYVQDSNSTNHTFVNNEELQKDDCRLLISGDKIRFGREQYQFHYEN